MYKLKLIKGRSYSGGLPSGGVVTATEKKPVVTVDDLTDANDLVKTGYFTLVEIVKAPEIEAGSDNDDTDTEILIKKIGKMKTEELATLAEKLEVDISGCKTNEERREVLKEALTDSGTKLPFEEQKGSGE